MNDKSMLMINLCRITMNRLSLFSNVNKAHHKIDNFLNIPLIYIYKLEFCYNQFSKKVQEDNKDDDEDELIFIAILATTEKEIVYTAIF